MTTIELIHDSDCPNVEDARAQLRKACAQAGLEPRWVEWNRSFPDSPSYVWHYGSPSVLVNGKDVASLQPAPGGNCCRLYLGDKGEVRRSPAVEVIVAALMHSEEAETHSGNRANRFGWHGSLGILPGVATALLPKLACPFCWPAYAGLMSALGLGFLIQSGHLFLVTVVFLVVAVATLGFRVKMRRAYGPFLTGVFGAVLVITAKFVFESEPVTYLGVGSLIFAGFWNCWPMNRKLYNLNNRR